MPGPHLQGNPDRRELPDGWITRYDDKCVSTAPIALLELTQLLLRHLWDSYRVWYVGEVSQ